jgi:hypothetical protein
VHALINKQYIQASRVAAVLSFNQNMPRAPHGAPVLGPQPEQVTGRQQKPGGAKTGPRSGSVPECDSDEDSDDEPLAVAAAAGAGAGAGASKPFLDLS